jgi:hypothetical protein
MFFAITKELKKDFSVSCVFDLKEIQFHNLRRVIEILREKKVVCIGKIKHYLD